MASNNSTIQVQLRNIVIKDEKVLYILFRYAPHLINFKNINTFADLKAKYKCFDKIEDEDFCIKWLSEENVQIAIRWLLKRTHQNKMIELYNVYFDRAKTDVQAFKEFMNFSNTFFKDDKDSELLAILNNIREEDLDLEQ